MKINHPKQWSVRTVRKFLWFPLTLKGETRWLEWATTKQMYIYNAGPLVSWKWADQEWI